MTQTNFSIQNVVFVQSSNELASILEKFVELQEISGDTEDNISLNDTTLGEFWCSKLIRNFYVGHCYYSVSIYFVL